MLTGFLEGELFGFFLVFSRIGSGLMLLPGFGEIYVSPRFRLLLALAITLVITPLVSSGLPVMPEGFLALFTLLIGEIVVGLFLGATARFLLVVLQTTGFLVAQATNLAAAQVFDPNQGTQGTLTGNFLGIMGVLLIFVTNLHHMMLGALIRSYEVFPSGATPPSDDFASMATRLVSDGVELALQLAAPVMLFALIFQVGLGLMARLMPQMHVFFIGMPLQIMLGFAIFAMSLGAIMTWYLDRFVRPFSEILSGG
ncbi:MAG: flagellar biosynthetic protein FliR [Alphaproteobacteria bacterium]|jgi:flagellar biosynthetic protein FliR|nr:flagellar biosynthetic protein FliR [Alphaproteobacteria bacterium]